MPPEVGEFKVNVLEWGTERTGFSSNIFELQTHACSQEELGLKRTEQTRVFPLVPGIERWISPEQKWFCLDEKDTKLISTYSYTEASMIRIEINHCPSKKGC